MVLPMAGWLLGSAALSGLGSWFAGRQAANAQMAGFRAQNQQFKDKVAFERDAAKFNEAGNIRAGFTAARMADEDLRRQFKGKDLEARLLLPLQARAERDRLKGLNNLRESAAFRRVQDREDKRQLVKDLILANQGQSMTFSSPYGSKTIPLAAIRQPKGGRMSRYASMLGVG